MRGCGILIEEFLLLLVHMDKVEPLILVLVWHLFMKLVNHALVV